MSRHNRLPEKAIRRAVRSTHRTPPGFVNLIEWLRLRHPMSRGKARAIIAAKLVKVDSHVVGLREVPDAHGGTMLIVDPYITASARGRITVSDL